MSNLPDIPSYFKPEIVALFAEVHQPRSQFQLEKFVINQHDTDEMRYYQCVTELQSLYYTIKEVSLQMQKNEIEVERLRATGDAIDEIEAQIKELGMEQTRVVATGAIREFDTLLKILEQFPAYTRKDIELNQSEYWQLRLEKQRLSPVDQAIEQTKTKLKEIT